MDKKQFQEEFKKTLDNMYLIMLKKNADYAKTDPFGNFKLVEELGITNVEKGILVRIADKISRITNLIDKEAQVKDESIEDTLQDLANYAVILKIYLQLGKKCAEHDKRYISNTNAENKTKNKFTVDEKYNDLMKHGTNSNFLISEAIQEIRNNGHVIVKFSNGVEGKFENINDYITNVILKGTTTN